MELGKRTSLWIKKEIFATSCSRTSSCFTRIKALKLSRSILKKYEQIVIFDEENFLILDKEKQLIKYDQSGNQTAKFRWK